MHMEPGKLYKIRLEYFENVERNSTIRYCCRHAGSRAETKH